MRVTTGRQQKKGKLQSLEIKVNFRDKNKTIALILSSSAQFTI